jgi:hypothetical protein
MIAKAALKEEDVLTCRQCETDMPEYLTIQLEGGISLPQRLLAIRMHIETCPYCYERYQTLSETNQDILLGKLPAALDIPEPDLSFLHSQENPLQIISEHFSNLKEVIVAQLTSIQLQPQLMPSRREISRQAFNKVDQIYYAEELAVDVNLTLEYGRAGQIPATLRGQLVPLEQTLAQLDGNSVALFKEREIAGRSQISASGNFAFSNLDQGQYFIVIQWNESQNLLLEVQIKSHREVKGEDSEQQTD